MELVKCEIGIRKTVEKIYRAIKRAQDFLAGIDRTKSIGINLSGTFFGVFSYNAQIGVSMDTKGNVALQDSFGGGMTTLVTPSISLTLYESTTNAPEVSRLKGEWGQIGGSAVIPIEGFPLAVGGDFVMIPHYVVDGDDIYEESPPYFGVTGNIGVGVPGVEGHVEWGETWTMTRSDEPIQINIFDMIDDLYAKIME